MSFSGIGLAEQGWIPDSLIRRGIRSLLAARLREEARGGQFNLSEPSRRFAEEMKRREIVESAAAANEQHYEVPSGFYQRILGPRLKYSCGYWQAAATTLAQSEEDMLDMTCQRAEFADGMRILELGCGWGSLSIWMASRYPHASILAISNSHSQRQYIQEKARELSLHNLTVVTCDVAQFRTDEQFDRVVSVEMFEHLRNYDEMLRRISGWLTSGGKLFVHIFCHRQFPYFFESREATDWMARHFFTGGIMPSYDLLTLFPERLAVTSRWIVNGSHYSRTCEAWLARLDAQHQPLLELLGQSRPEIPARRQLQRRRIFLLSCAELFRYGGGEEWFVGHYLLEKNQQQ